MVHLDAAKSFVQTAKLNVHNSFKNNKDSSVRYIIDDCITFLDREIKRKRTYEGLIFDPPAFGRASNGKIWNIETDLPQLIQRFPVLLSNRPAFVLLSCHDEVSYTTCCPVSEDTSVSN